MFDGMPEHRAIARAGVNRQAERLGHAEVIGGDDRSSKFKSRKPRSPCSEDGEPTVSEAVDVGGGVRGEARRSEAEANQVGWRTIGALGHGSKCSRIYLPQSWLTQVLLKHMGGSVSLSAEKVARSNENKKVVLLN